MRDYSSPQARVFCAMWALPEPYEIFSLGFDLGAFGYWISLSSVLVTPKRWSSVTTWPEDKNMKANPQVGRCITMDEKKIWPFVKITHMTKPAHANFALFGKGTTMFLTPVLERLKIFFKTLLNRVAGNHRDNAPRISAASEQSLSSNRKSPCNVFCWHSRYRITVMSRRPPPPEVVSDRKSHQNCFFLFFFTIIKLSHRT